MTKVWETSFTVLSCCDGEFDKRTYEVRCSSRLGCASTSSDLEDSSLGGDSRQTMLPFFFPSEKTSPVALGCRALNGGCFDSREPYS